MNESTELIELSSIQEEREEDQMGQYAQELDAEKEDAGKRAETRKHTLWGDMGLVEYNQETITWECRIGDCAAKIETEKRISNHRKNTIHTNISDPSNRT